MISVENLHKRFGRVNVLDGMSFEVNSGNIAAILGPNGSGKTTLLKTILGMVLAQKGQIFFDRQPVSTQWNYRRKIGYLPQIARFPDNLTVAELIGMMRNIRNARAHATELIGRFGIENHLHKKLGNLSGGTKQKVNIVLTFMFDNPLLILDEPTAGLDPVSLIQLKKLIREEKARGKTFLLTTHIMSLVEELSDEIIFLLEGRIYFQGTVEALRFRMQEADLEHAIAKLLQTHA